ncbi:MAG TPA: hypothetical protein VFT60_00900 [Bryobacteraceae bacterium]|nr:hypothetical protein [Bryobacteraceae bacterium]
MRQALHILRKDAQYLRGEIVLVLALMALLGYTAAPAVEILALLAMNYLIARVIHAEPIPGHNQFWITRPYRWQSLFGSKLLFVLLFIDLPLLGAQIYALLTHDFSLSSNLPGLLWSQALYVTCLFLPVMCLASLTSGPIPFLVTEFIVAAEILIAEGVVHGHFTWNQFLPGAKPGPQAMDWVRDFIVMAIVVAFSGIALYSQYRTRNSAKGRKTAVLGLAAAGAVFLLLPWPVMMSLQAAISRESFHAAPLKMELAPVRYAVFPAFGRRNGPEASERICLPLRLNGVPDNREVGFDSISVTLEARDGRSWSSGVIAPISVEGEDSIVDASLSVDPAFLMMERAHPVTARAKVYLTLFGDPHSATIPLEGGPPVNAVDGLQCSVGLFNQLSCRSIFRWPGKRVYVSTRDGVGSYVRSFSYSPFPAELGFNPVEAHSFSSGLTSKEAVITTKAPLSHFSFEAKMDGVVLNDYTAAARQKAILPTMLIRQ